MDTADYLREGTIISDHVAGKNQRYFKIQQISNGYLVSFGSTNGYWFFSSKAEVRDYLMEEIDSIWQDLEF
jgi:hypothetical protein